MGNLGEEQAYLLAVMNRPGGFLPDYDLDVGTQKENRQPFLRGEGLEQVKVLVVPWIDVGSAFKRRNRSPGDPEDNCHHPGAFFSLVRYCSGRDGESLATKR